MSTKQYSLVVFVVVISILGAFYSGFYLNKVLGTEKVSGSASDYQLYRPNFIDEVIITTKEEPRKTLILSGIRTFVKRDVINYTVKVFYFDGNKWTKKIEEGKSNELDSIPKTSIVPIWKIIDDPSYMLKQSVSGEVAIDNHKIKFDIPIIQNEMSIRSSPKYTKFMSEEDSILEINNKEYDSHVVYSRIYSFSPPESLIFTSDPAGIETEWLAFWDKEGNFYSIDETIIDNKKTLESYKAHSLGVLKDKDDRVQKSFVLDLNKISKQKYSVEIKDNINKIISIEKLNSTNKSVNGIDIWTTGLVEGTVKTSNGKTINGFGVYEQISQ